MKILLLVESITGHTQLSAGWLKDHFSAMNPPVDTVIKDMTDACELRDDAPALFSADDHYDDVDVVILAFPVYCSRPDEGLDALLNDGARFNVPASLKSKPFFACAFCDSMIGWAPQMVYNALRAQGYDARNGYGFVSPRCTKGGPESFEEQLKATAEEIIELSALNKESADARTRLEAIEKEMRVGKPGNFFAKFLSQSGIMCRMVGHKTALITDKCIGCGKCAKVCMRGVIKLEETPNGKRAVLVDPKHCIGCERCRRNCPADAITRPNHDAKAKNWENPAHDMVFVK